MCALVMGIVNVTPDSFSDGGHFFDARRAVDHGLNLIAEGASVLDIGGESTRPGAEPVDARTEMDRVLPVISALAPLVRISVDTTKAEVAHAAIDAGATIVNDVGASLYEVAAERQVGWIAMHMLGTPTTMQEDPTYEDVVAEVEQYLCARAELARQAGVDEVMIDPGIGFGKTAAQNWALLSGLSELAANGWPVVVGTSRKGFLGAKLAEANVGNEGTVAVNDRLDASVTTAVWAARHGAHMLRVHDVAATTAALEAAAELSDEKKEKSRWL